MKVRDLVVGGQYEVKEGYSLYITGVGYLPSGTKVEVISTNRHYGFKIKVISGLPANLIDYDKQVSDPWLSSAVSLVECSSHVDIIKRRISSYKSQIKELQSKISEEEAKLKWVEANKVEKFDEQEYKIFQAISILDKKNASKMDKVKAISEIIKSKK